MKKTGILKLPSIKTSLKNIKNLPREVFLYLAYGFFCLLLFIYIRFPYEKIQDVLLTRFAEKNSYTVLAEEKKFKFPLGFRWRNVRVGKTENFSQESAYRIDELAVRINLIPLIILRKSLDFDCKAYGGETGWSLVIKNNGYKVAEETIKELDLSKIFSSKNTKESKVIGTIAPAFDLFVPKEGLSFSNGSVSIKLKNFRIENIFPLLPKIYLTELKSEIKFLKGRGSVKVLEATGDDVKVIGRGNIDFGKTLNESRLNLSLKVTTMGKSPFGKLISVIGGSRGRSFIPVTVTGNLSKPIIRVSGIMLN
ncbi:MAG: type II secretion system protein GspN [Candidatus Schekmanbacteria bacterium RIFCSPHIGHO2_02_FULL_38_11]|uniref:Type II secretion system protein GspN n=1 Tax=Candidatus Schekmanbacteria bacterium RIFCSPLOWO2_12_FULL_38_15 TaxID=1817883 RepID=A0A1F7SFP4_9BACT|nr:MAG: type II secretion system protein GspN [Candidatus Schekmanbacteria bacterium GWA2_38_9]OGL49069.1 MAG: type II secretion system protein GspN [Candidatus Schekmanbacteria bacterium RIFCSPLOWO2_02_FULL_38_14]OGL49193.1 MAG: type II secretion system protein GspN [Candidatus Schekmanbacteria bacterium RIFCSPHIGHO2_02_FULL_38_11]OGL52044.1 MAG: type II secretion system protein GspN [Candidatus Schekmanbacteria bacterium RIFCSPLOWO2_12_FULL_38_15]